MPLIELIIVLAVVGVVLWAINSYLPMQANVKKYAFAGREAGLVTVLLRKVKSRVTLSIHDDSNAGRLT
jgi:Tfp pilus assembly protein PilE